MIMLKFLVSAVASTALVVGIGCSHTSTKTTTGKYMSGEDRVVTTEDTMIRRDTYEPPVVVNETASTTFVAEAPVPAPQPVFVERVAKADRN